MTIGLNDPLRLPCGAVIGNRLVKAAMTEGLADPLGRVTPELEGIYDDWGRGGFGLLITGNVIVDGDHLERPGNVIVDGEADEAHLHGLSSWVRTATAHGSHVWAQLSHSGRQTPRMVNAHPLSPSATRMGLPGWLFGRPREMSPLEIDAVAEKFASAARVCRAAGFTGLQIHAAHGYLLSSFLNPAANRRTDRWGGTRDNRARLLHCVVRAVREAVGFAFPISVKLNSADFQRGGFEPGDSRAVASELEDGGIDLLEISGGAYESPAMMGEEGAAGLPRSASTLAREAYFFDFARELRREIGIPIMLTGGLRSRDGMQAALDEGIDLLGIARPACIDPYCAGKLLDGTIDRLESWEEHVRHEKGLLGARSPVPLVRTINSFAGIYWFYAQILRAGEGRPFAPGLSPMLAMMQVQARERKIQSDRRRMGVAAPFPVSASRPHFPRSRSPR